MPKEKKQQLVRFDWAMKSILRNKANFDVLEGFLTSLLGEEIKVMAVLESESNKDRLNEKNNRVDLKCEDADGKHIIIEIQTQYEYDYMLRMLFGTSKAVVESMSTGEEYKNVPKIISISILYHGIDKDNNDYIYHGKTDMVGLNTGEKLKLKQDAKLLPEECSVIMPEYYFICVNSFHDKIKAKIDEWIYFFKNEAIKEDFSAPGIKAAQKKLNYLAMTKEEQARYFAYWDDQQYLRSTLNTAQQEGFAAGEAAGAEKERLDTIKKMGKANMSISQIAEIYGLEQEQISKILNE